MDVNLDLLVTDSFDVDARHGTALQLVLQVAADVPVFVDMVGIVDI